MWILDKDAVEEALAANKAQEVPPASQAQVAKKAGMTPQQMSSCMTRGRVTLDTAMRIATALGLKVREIATREERD